MTPTAKDAIVRNCRLLGAKRHKFPASRAEARHLNRLRFGDLVTGITALAWSGLTRSGHASAATAAKTASAPVIALEYRLFAADAFRRLRPDRRGCRQR